MNQEIVTLDVRVSKTTPMPESAFARLLRKFRKRGPRIAVESFTVRVSGVLQKHHDKEWYENGYTLWMTPDQAALFHAYGVFPDQVLVPLQRSLCLDLRRVDFEIVTDEARSSEPRVG